MEKPATRPKIKIELVKKTIFVFFPVWSLDSPYLQTAPVKFFVRKVIQQHCLTVDLCNKFQTIFVPVTPPSLPQPPTPSPPKEKCFKQFFLLYLVLMRQLVTALIQYGGRNVRSSDLFGQNKTPLSLTRRFFKGLKVCVARFHF